MEFKDFEGKEKDLVGKTVLHTSGSIHGTRTNKITTIDRVLKTSFTIVGADGKFNVINGEERGVGRASWGTISVCRLLTNEEAKELKLKWAENKEKKALLAEATEKIKTATLEQLKEIQKILNP